MFPIINYKSCMSTMHIYQMVQCTHHLFQYCFAEINFVNWSLVSLLLCHCKYKLFYYVVAGAMEMREWMVVIDAVVQGAPEDALRRRKTVSNYFAAKRKKKVKFGIY